MANRIELTAIDSRRLGEDFALMRIVVEPSRAIDTIRHLESKIDRLDHYIKVGYVSDKEPEFNFRIRDVPYCVHFLNEIERLKFLKGMHDKLSILTKILGIKSDPDDDWEIPF